MNRPEKILFVFLDGVGIGLPDPAINPLLHGDAGFFPLIQDAEQGTVTRRAEKPEAVHRLARAGFHVALDACLEVPGTPQSATGQASLFTGINCAQLMGRHWTAFPPDPIAQVVSKQNLLLRAQQAGHPAAFLNTYSPRFYELGWPHSVSTLCALSLGRPLLMLDEMREGRCLYHDLTNDGLHTFYGDEIPLFTPHQSGGRLVGAASHWEVSLFEHFWTDRTGHKANLDLGVRQVRKVEAFLAGVLEAAEGTGMLVVMSSDHGNLEDLRHKGHTRNPVPLSAWGPGAEWLTTRCQSLLDVTPALLELLTYPLPHTAV